MPSFTPVFKADDFLSIIVTGEDEEAAKIYNLPQPTAMNQGLNLYTEDKVLGQFASKYYNATILDNSDSIVVSFPHKDETQRIIEKSESKGYINRGWQYSMRKGNF